MSNFFQFHRILVYTFALVTIFRVFPKCVPSLYLHSYLMILHGRCWSFAAAVILILSSWKRSVNLVSGECLTRSPWLRKRSLLFVRRARTAEEERAHDAGECHAARLSPSFSCLQIFSPFSLSLIIYLTTFDDCWP